MDSLLVKYGTDSVATLILAHGAGAAMDSDFMNAQTAALNDCGIDVVRFEFPYMQQRRATGKKRPPDRQPVLLAHWHSVCSTVAAWQTPELAQLAGPIWIGGKSMGGRMATLAANELVEKFGLAGVCCFGFPFYPPGKTGQSRIEHLLTTAVPTLIVQGTRDPFGKPQQIDPLPLSEQVSITWLEAGDHDFKPTVRSGFSQSQHIKSAADAVRQFIQNHI